MSQPVKVSDLEMDAAARINSRSIAGQGEQWMRIGGAVERDPSLSFSRIEMALRGLEALDLDTLEDAAPDDFIERMTQTSPKAAQDFWRDRKTRGVGVGLDVHGELEFGGKTGRR